MTRVRPGSLYGLNSLVCVIRQGPSRLHATQSARVVLVRVAAESGYADLRLVAASPIPVCMKALLYTHVTRAT